MAETAFKSESGTDIGEPDLNTTFQFNVQIGVGTHYFFLDDMALTLQVRGIHLSNAQIVMPNNGTNSILFMIGATDSFKMRFAVTVCII